MKISVVVPVFNTFKYLEKCVLSLTCQTFKDLEIILVDDGSTDGSGVLCDKFKKKFNNVVVVHKTNGGLSSARNAGVKVASGNYIGFVDSDDYVDCDMYEKLFDLLDGRTGDTIACANFRKVYSDDRIEEKHILFDSKTSQTKEEYLRDLLLHKGDVSVCTKLFPKSLVSSHSFEQNTLNEDLLYMFNLNFKNIVFLGSTKYNYFVREGSITNSFSKAFVAMGKNSIYIQNKVLDEYPSLTDVGNRFAIVQNLYLLLRFPTKEKNKNPVFCKSKEYLVNNYKTAMTNVYITKKEKFYIKAIKYFPNIFLFFYHIFR